MQLSPWKKQKALMYSIYKHRIEHAPELNGTCNMNYCCMNEHVIMYFLDKFKAREAAEL